MMERLDPSRLLSIPTIDAVNVAVGLLHPGAYFRRTERGLLYLHNMECKHYPKLRWRLRSDHLWPYDRRSATFTGGTIVAGLTQLSLWLLGKPRRPLRYWAGLTGPLVWPETERERGKKLYDYLADSSYPYATYCIKCGADDPRDWWSLDGNTGPCCMWGKCNRDKSTDQ